MLNLTRLSGVRKIEGQPVESLTSTQQEAIAYAQSVGTKASATAAEAQGWRMSATVAIGIQQDIQPTSDDDSEVWNRRIKEIESHRDAVIEACKSSLLTQAAADLGFATHVKAPKAKKGEDVIDSPQALMMKAQKRIENYYNNRLIAAWKAHILIKFLALSSGDIVPESAGKLSDRVKNATRAAAPATGVSDLKGAFGKTSGDLGAILPANMTLETSAAAKAILAGAYACILLTVNGTLSQDEAKGIGQELQDHAREAASAAGATLESMGADNSDESVHGTEESGERVAA